jgi:hypothetical protein
MTDVILDPPRDDKAWRKKIYDGDIIILSPTPELLALVEHTRSMIEDAFVPLDPQRVHESLAVELTQRVSDPLDQIRSYRGPICLFGHSAQPHVLRPPAPAGSRYIPSVACPRRALCGYTWAELADRVISSCCALLTPPPAIWVRSGQPC